MEEEPTQYNYRWVYYDEEDEFDKLVEACNIKGIRERKLQENLRKIKERLKLKKSKKASATAKDQEMKTEKKEIENGLNDEQIEQLSVKEEKDEEMHDDSQNS